MASLDQAGTRLVADVRRLCRLGLAPADLLRRLADRLGRTVGFDASFWWTTDPATLLPTGGLVDHLPLEGCHSLFDNELLVPDVNKFVDLARLRRRSACSPWPPLAGRRTAPVTVPARAG